jgi:hypothetical protein
MIESIYGLKVFIDDRICVKIERKQVRFPRSNKVRIRKKWAKQRKNFAEKVAHVAYRQGRNLFVSTEIYKSLKNGLIDEMKTHPLFSKEGPTE